MFGNFFSLRMFCIITGISGNLFSVIQPGLQEAILLRESNIVVTERKKRNKIIRNTIQLKTIPPECIREPSLYYRGMSITSERFYRLINEDNGLVAQPFSTKNSLTLLSSIENNSSDLLNPAHTLGGQSTFVRFSNLPSIAGYFSYPTGIVILWYGVAYDVNCINPQNQHFHEQEFVVPGLIYSNEILGHFPVINGALKEFISNNSFNVANASDIFSHTIKNEIVTKIKAGISARKNKAKIRNMN